jgi:biotin operon repressor
MKLRDFYGSLDELCADLDVSRTEIEEKLRAAGFEYNEELNKFW